LHRSQSDKEAEETDPIGALKVIAPGELQFDLRRHDFRLALLQAPA
jgi:hypothetical protein